MRHYVREMNLVSGEESVVTSTIKRCTNERRTTSFWFFSMDRCGQKGKYWSPREEDMSLRERAMVAKMLVSEDPAI